MKLPFDLLSDWDREVSKQYGAFNFRERVADRASFLIDKKGIIRFTQKATLIKPRDIDAMIGKIQELIKE